MSEEPEESSSRGVSTPRSPRGLALGKDKGKDRSVDSPDKGKDRSDSHSVESEPGTPEVPVVIIIKVSDGSIPDIPLHIPNVLETTVSDIRRQIRVKAGGITLNRRLRLICAGKVLNDQMNVAKEVTGVELDASGKVVKGPRGPRVYVHCAVGDILTPAELAKEAEYDTRVTARSTLPELRGFDRLRDTGFSDEDIRALRDQFGRFYGRTAENGTGNTPDGENSVNAAAGGVVVNPPQERDEELTRMEEQWIETGANDALPEAGALMGGDYLDDLIGILIGMFLGVFALLACREELFSARRRRLLFIGVAVNFSFGLLRLLM